MVSLVDIPFSLNLDQLSEQLRIKPRTDRAKEFEDLARMVRETGKPKALYKVSFIDEKGEDTVTLDGVTFKSLALRKNLESVGRVFPYIVTCGTEIDEIEVGQGNVPKKLWLSLLKGILLQTGVNHLREYLERRYRVPRLATMNPGSGDASVWPFEQQKNLFSILGDAEKLIGVKLTQSLVLVPDMSVSGILFPAETNFESCQLCHREDCRFRRAPFNRELWELIFKTEKEGEKDK